MATNAKRIPTAKSPYNGGQKQGSGGRGNSQRGMTMKPGTNATTKGGKGGGSGGGKKMC